MLHRLVLALAVEHRWQLRSSQAALQRCLKLTRHSRRRKCASFSNRRHRAQASPNTAIGFGVPNVYRSALQWGIVCSPPIIIPQADSVLVGIAATSLTPITSAELTIESTGRTEQIRLGSAGNLHFVRIPRQGNDSLRLWFMLSDGQRTRRHPVTDAFYVRTSDTLLPCAGQRESINAIADSRMQESAPLTQCGHRTPAGAAISTDSSALGWDAVCGCRSPTANSRHSHSATWRRESPACPLSTQEPTSSGSKQRWRYCFTPCVGVLMAQQVLITSAAGGLGQHVMQLFLNRGWR